MQPMTRFPQLILYKGYSVPGPGLANPRFNNVFLRAWTEMEGPGRGLDRAWTGPGQCIQRVFSVEEWTLAENIYAP